MTEKELIALKEKIEQAKTRASQLQGQQEYMMKELKKNFNCSSVEEAKELLSGLTTKIDKLTKQITTGLKQLEEQINA